MRREPEVRYAVLKNLTDELIADATCALEDLVKSLARTSAPAISESSLPWTILKSLAKC